MAEPIDAAGEDHVGLGALRLGVDERRDEPRGHGIRERRCASGGRRPPGPTARRRAPRRSSRPTVSGGRAASVAAFAAPGLAPDRLRGWLAAFRRRRWALLRAWTVASPVGVAVAAPAAAAPALSPGQRRCVDLVGVEPAQLLGQALGELAPRQRDPRSGWPGCVRVATAPSGRTRSIGAARALEPTELMPVPARRARHGAPAP